MITKHFLKIYIDICDAITVGVGVENLWRMYLYGIVLEVNYRLAINVLYIFIDNFFADVALGLEAFFALMRYVSVMHPHRAASIYTKRLLWRVTAILFLKLIPKNVFFGSANSPIWPPDKGVWGTVADYLNVVVKTGIPASIVFTRTLLIGIALSKSIRLQRKQIATDKCQVKLKATGFNLTEMLIMLNF